MPPFVLGLAGGSGSGKSTLALGLLDRFHDQVLIFHLDDYFRPQSDVPLRAGMVNWDDPKALYYHKMAHDLARLKAGQPVIINTKSPRLNPDFLKTGKRIPVEFQPKPLIVVEGFLTLYYPKIRRLLDLSIYLSVPFEIHSKRRIHGKLHNFPPQYDELVLWPMHEKYVEPSKLYADVIVHAANLSQTQVLDRAISLIQLKTKI